MPNSISPSLESSLSEPCYTKVANSNRLAAAYVPTKLSPNIYQEEGSQTLIAAAKHSGAGSNYQNSYSLGHE